jgi:hypothetical protein
MLDGRPVFARYTRGEANRRRAAEVATDNFCRRLGYRDSARHVLVRTPRGEALEDVLCLL